MTTLKHVVVAVASDHTLVLLHRQDCIRIDGSPGSDLPGAWLALTESGRVPDFHAHGPGRDLLPHLAGAGLIADRTPGSISKADFLEIAVDAATMWKRHSVLHPIFRLLGDEQDRRALLLGLLVEITYYARRMPHLAASAAAALTNVDAAGHLVEFSEIEMPHYQDMANAASEEAGLSADQLLLSRPSPPMIGLLALLESLAFTRPLSYSAALAFAEADASTASDAALAFEEVSATNSVSARTLKPFADHARDDGDLGHEDIARTVLDIALPDEITAADADTILNDVHDVKHGWDLVYDDLIRRYPCGSTFRPRSSVSAARF